MTKKLLIAFSLLLIGALPVVLNSCKSCKKSDDSTTITTDTTTTTNTTQYNTITAPHGDTTIIPVLAKVLTEAFEASKKKDYAALATYIVYRGTDQARHGTGVFTVKNTYEKSIVKITSDVFNKWNTGVNNIEYGRVFELPQPSGQAMPVLEVIFIADKTVDRKFFGFLELQEGYKIADITSWIE